MNNFPLIAIVGRPNVGKSTLFNRLVGSRRAIVGDEPGITRDRLYGEGHWRGYDFRIVDTGGIIPEDKDFIPSEIFRQARVALDEAAAIVMVVDARAELAAPDLELARLLRKTGKPLFVAANKVDSDKQSSLADDLHRLGIREIVAISAEHGRGVDDLLDAVLVALPAKNPTTEDTETTEGKATEGKSTERNSTEGAPSFPRSVREGGDVDSQLPSTEEYRKSKPQSQRSRRRQESVVLPTHDREPPADYEIEDVEAPTPSEVSIAIIGHPNVGKSTLLNQLTGADRSIVSPVPGTTRDAVDEVVERDGMKFRFIDTAGIRRKGKTHLMAEKLSVVMARKHLEAADIALLIIDATEGVSALDAAIAGYAHESGRSMIIVVNKWDLITSGEKKAVSQSRTARIQESKRPDDRAAYEQRLRYALKFLSYAPVLFVSAAKGKGTEKIFPTLEKVAAERRKRVTTGEMNRFLKHVDFDRASVPVRQRVKILYLTQAAVAPPTFILFTDRQVKLHFSYQRFLENQIRAAFGFEGTPIWIKVRAR
ncbi:MAG TPA: ribosome biogenesis GTPase Der [Terriglobales bacterium]|nr:ribosome biogenesis GTPase Der [Terriglobales bacterium]